MSIERLTALAMFAVVSSMSPGPNNLMLMASGVHFGFRRTLPHMAGVAIGFTVMMVLVGLGLGAVFEAYPALHLVLRVVGSLYMLWLAWRIATAGPVQEGASGGAPMTFLGAVMFQWVNPKAWIIAVTAIAAYAVASDYFTSVLIVAGVFGLMNLPAIGSWVAFGTALRGVLRDPGRARAFNITMALLLVASLWPVVAGG